MNCLTEAKRLLSAFLFLPVVASVPICGPQTKPVSTRDAAEADIREAVLRHQMLDWARNGDKDETEAKDESEKQIAHMLNFKIFFIEIDGKDASDDFLRRFQDIPRFVKKRSSAEQDQLLMRMPVVDKNTREPGIIFYVDKIRWRMEHHVKLDGGYQCDGLCGAGLTFEVWFENGKWVVKGKRMNWIS